MQRDVEQHGHDETQPPKHCHFDDAAHDEILHEGAHVVLTQVLPNLVGRGLGLWEFGGLVFLVEILTDPSLRPVPLKAKSGAWKKRMSCPGLRLPAESRAHFTALHPKPDLVLDGWGKRRP